MVAKGMFFRAWPKGRGLPISTQSNTFFTWDTITDFILSNEVCIALYQQARGADFSTKPASTPLNRQVFSCFRISCDEK